MTETFKLSAIGLALSLVLSAFSGAHASDDNLLAHRLYQQGDYVQAGEIFTDPAWKGLALYRSSQWWRAAEAFIRANDALSAFNLGNCYVQLGYYALALEAYQRALSLDPELEDAEHNADIMRALLSAEDEENERGGRSPGGDEIEQLESENTPEDGGTSSEGEQDTEKGETAPGKPDNKDMQAGQTDQQAQPGKGAAPSDDEQGTDQPEGEGSDAINGNPAEQQEQNGRPSGGSDNDQPSEDTAAAGVRTELETEQATTQWLNRIQHDPQLFLQRRLKLEQRRRRAAGQAPPQGGSTW